MILEQKLVSTRLTGFGEEIERNPNDARLRLFYGSFLRQIGAQPQAEAALLKAHELTPEKQSVMFELGVLHLDQGNSVEALEWFKRAHEVEPAYDRARNLYAAALIRSNELAIADALLIERYDTVTPDDDAILQAYRAIGSNDRMVAVAESRVENDPENFQAHLQLAGVYLEVNRREDSISTLETAITLNPDFAEQGNFFISEIRAGRNP